MPAHIRLLHALSRHHYVLDISRLYQVGYGTAYALLAGLERRGMVTHTRAEDGRAAYTLTTLGELSVVEADLTSSREWVALSRLFPKNA